MGPLKYFLFVYTLGTITFPILLALAFYIGSSNAPGRDETTREVSDDPAGLKQADDEDSVIRTATDNLEDKFRRKHDSDVAAGYFAVTRDYVPGGVNGESEMAIGTVLAKGYSRKTSRQAQPRRRGYSNREPVRLPVYVQEHIRSVAEAYDRTKQGRGRQANEESEQCLLRGFEVRAVRKT
jgi:hypothetical protein